MKKIEPFIRHEAFEPIRSELGKEGEVVLRAHSEGEIAAGAAAEE